MKKYLYIAIIISFFVISHNAFATSGACSDHGGVSCSAGASADGNAICNDGSESSVSYFLMKECVGTSTYITTEDACSPSFPINAFTQYTQSTLPEKQILKDTENSYITQIKNLIDSVNNNANANIQKITQNYNSLISQVQSAENSKLNWQIVGCMSSSGGVGNSTCDPQYIKAEYDPKIQSLTAEMNTAINNQKSIADSFTSPKNICISSLTALLAKMTSYSQMLDSCNSIPNSVPADNGSGNFNSCACASGYSRVKGQCVSSISTPAPIIAPSTTDTTNILPVIEQQSVYTPTLITQTSKTPKTKPVKQTIIIPVPQQNITQTTQSVAPTPTPQKEGFFKKAWGFLVNYFKPIKSN